MAQACGKPCRSETEKQLHTQRNPGHTEYVDATAAAAGPVDYTINKDDPMDVDDETKKMLAAATGKDPAAIEKAAAAKAAKGEQEGVPHAFSVLTED